MIDFDPRDLNYLSNREIKDYFDKLDNLLEIRDFANHVYYNSGDEFLSDSQYDILLDVIKSRDENFVEDIGCDTHLEKVKLPYFLGSLNKIKNTEEKKMQLWLKKFMCNDYIVEYKLDGISCLIDYMNSDEPKIYTRGNGDYGVDITCIKEFVDIPYLKNLCVRGELIISKNAFENNKGKYKNPRNMVSGLVNSKEYNDNLKCIDFVAYEMVSVINNPKLSPELQLETLTVMGFKVVNYHKIKHIDNETLLPILNEGLEKKYEIDGLVIQPNFPYRRSNTGNPKHIFAYKVNNEDKMKVSKVLEVEWSVSRLGVLKPRVKIESVIIDGVEINYATGHNAKYIIDNNIGPDTEIVITRSGDVIPYIVRIIKGTKPQLPVTSYKWNETGIDIMQNVKDDEQNIKAITYFFQSLDVKFLNKQTIKKIYDYGLQDIESILQVDKNTLLNIDTFKEKTTNRILNNITKLVEGIEQYKLLSSYGIFGKGISNKKLKLLFEEYPNIIEDYKICVDKEIIRKNIINVKGFSNKSADKILEKLDDVIDLLYRMSIIFKEIRVCRKLEKDNRLFLNKKFIFSGFRDQNLEKIIEKEGGKISSSVSKNIDYIIVKDIDSTSNKVVKAKNLGLKLTNLDKFKEHFGLKY